MIAIPGRILRALRGRIGRDLVKVVVYTGLCVVVLAGLVGRIGNIDWFAKHDTYRAELPDVTGLSVNDRVKIAGVEVGKVTGIKVERGHAVVTFQLDRGKKLPTDTGTAIRWRNVIGQKYLYLHPGRSKKMLKPGDRIPLDQARSSADVGAFLNAVGPVLQAIDPAKANAFIAALNEALDGNEQRVRDLIGNTATISRTLGDSDDEVSRVITNLDTVVTSLADRDGDLRTVISRFGRLSTTLADNNDQIQTLIDRLTSVQDSLSELVDGNRADLDQTITNLKVITEVVADHRDDLDATLATLPDGLRVYDTISSYGQWFQIRVKYTCLANQTTCVDEGVTSNVLDNGANVGSILNFALTQVPQ